LETRKDGEPYAVIPYRSIFRRSQAFGVDAVPLGDNVTALPTWDHSLEHEGDI